MQRNIEELLEIKKAFEANPGITDIAQLVDGPALSMVHIDTIMSGIVSTDEDFTFIRDLPKVSVDQVVAQYNQLKSHGGSRYWRSSHVTSSGDPKFSDAYIKRLFDEMSYLAEGFDFDRVIKKTNNIADPEVVQATSTMRRLLEGVSTSVWHGDKSTLSVEMDGLIKKTASLGSEFVIDCRGQLPTHDMIASAANQIRTRYRGHANGFYMPFGTKSLFDQASLGDKQYIFADMVANQDGITAGRVVRGARVTAAHRQLIEFRPDMFLDISDLSVPTDWNRSNDTQVEAAVGDNPPDMPTIAVAASASVPGSQWAAGDAGTVAYRVVAMSEGGSSIASAQASATVAAGGALTVTITPAVTGAPAEAFAILRETKPGNGDFRLVKRISKSTSPTTVFVDLNDDLPGTAVGLLGDFNARGVGDETSTIQLAELMPPMKTLFPPGIKKMRLHVGMIEWYCVVQNKAPQKFVVFKNLPIQ